MRSATTETSRITSPPAPDTVAADADLRRRARRNVLSTMIGRTATIGLSVLGTLWIIHYLGPDRYGLFVVLISIVTLLDLATELSIFEITVREIAKFPDQAAQWLGAATRIRIWIAVMMGAGMLAGSTILSRSAEDAWTIRLGAMLFVVNSLRTPVTYFRAQLRIQWELGLLSLSRVVELGLIALAIHWHWGATGLMAAKLLAAACFVITIWSVLLGRDRLRLQSGRAFIEPLIRLSIPVGITAVLLQVQLKGDILLIGSLLGKSAVGHFGAVAQIPEFVLVATTILIATTGPMLARLLSREETGRFQDVFQKVYAGLMFALPLLCTLGTVFATPLVRLAFGAAYLDVVPQFRIVLWVGGMIPLAAHLGVTAMTLNLQRKLVSVELVNVLIYLAGNVLLIPWFGTIASAWIRLLVVLIGPARTYLVLRRHSNFRLSARPALVAIPASLACAAAACLPLHGAIALIAGVSAYAAITVVCRAWRVQCNQPRP